MRPIVCLLRWYVSMHCTASSCFLLIALFDGHHGRMPVRSSSRFSGSQAGRNRARTVTLDERSLLACGLTSARPQIQCDRLQILDVFPPPPPLSPRTFPPLSFSRPPVSSLPTLAVRRNQMWFCLCVCVVMSLWVSERYHTPELFETHVKPYILILLHVARVCLRFACVSHAWWRVRGGRMISKRVQVRCSQWVVERQFRLPSTQPVSTLSLPHPHAARRVLRPVVGVAERHCTVHSLPFFAWWTQMIRKSGISDIFANEHAI